jgi:hypothetical protein
VSIAYYDRVCQEDIDTGVSTTTKRNPGGGTLTATQVGLHTLAIGQAGTSATWPGVDATPLGIASGSSTSTTVTVPGATLGDFAIASFSLSLSGLTLSAYVSAANTVTVVIGNHTGTVVSIAAATLKVLVLKSI